MKDWKVKQQLTQRLHQHDDFIDEGVTVVWDKSKMRPIEFEQSILSYFTIENDNLHYPQKSYAVAIVYSKLLEVYFDENFFEALNDPDLLLTDQHFVPYEQDKTTYDNVGALLTYWNLWNFETSNVRQVQTTVSYFKKEFMVV